MDISTRDTITEFALLGVLIALTGWLAWRYTGEGANQISPQFWIGVTVPLLGQLIRKTFDLKKPS